MGLESYIFKTTKQGAIEKKKQILTARNNAKSKGVNCGGMVLFINDSFLEKTDDAASLTRCFSAATDEGKYLYSVKTDKRKDILNAATELCELSKAPDDYGREMLMKSAFLKLMVYINRLSFGEAAIMGAISDEKIDKVIEYINENYKRDISIDDIADNFHISRSYLMHRFKDVTGGSVHSFVIQKRLNAALTMLREGTPAMETALVCGFSDYTVFYKSFRKAFGYNPTDALAK